MRPPRPEKKALLLLSISILAFTSVFSFIFLSITVKAYTLDDLINWLTSLLQPGGGGIRGQIFQGVGECAGVTGPAPSTWRFTCWVNGEKGGTFDCWDQSNNWKGYRACSSNEICNGPATGNWPCSVSGTTGTTTMTVTTPTGGTLKGIKKITVSRLGVSQDCGATTPEAVWDVYTTNGPTGLIPEIPTWNSNYKCQSGNMRINMEYTNDESTSAWFSF